MLLKIRFDEILRNLIIKAGYVPYDCTKVEPCVSDGGSKTYDLHSDNFLDILKVLELFIRLSLASSP